MVDLDQRAEAAKEYLEKRHWGYREASINEEEAERSNRLKEFILNTILEEKAKFSGASLKTGPLTLEEMKAIRKKAKRGKTPGPDNMTTDEIKDLDNATLEWLRQIINQWWETGNFPEEVTRARVVSLYKKGTQTNKRITGLLAY